MGWTESSLSTISIHFECLVHCKCTATNPFCKTCCGGDYCMCGIDTHEYDNEEDNNIQVDQVSDTSDKDKIFVRNIGVADLEKQAPTHWYSGIAIVLISLVTRVLCSHFFLTICFVNLSLYIHISILQYMSRPANKQLYEQVKQQIRNASRTFRLSFRFVQ